MKKLLFVFDNSKSGKRGIAEELAYATIQIAKKYNTVIDTNDRNFVKIIKINKSSQEVINYLSGADLFRKIEFVPIMEVASPRFACIGIVDNDKVNEITEYLFSIYTYN